MATATATTLSEAIIPTPVANVLKWTKQNVSPSAAAAAAIARVAKTVKADLTGQEIWPESESGTEFETIATPGAVQTQQESKTVEEKEETDKVERRRMRKDETSGTKSGPDTLSKRGKTASKRAKVQLTTEVKIEIEIDPNDPPMTQVGTYIQIQSKWEGFTLRQLVKDMVKQSTRFVRRTTWYYVGRALRYAASCV